MKKRLASTLLVLCMVLTFLPVSVFAAGSENTVYEISESSRNKTITSGSANNSAIIMSGWSRAVGPASMRYKVHSINWSISDTSVATIEKGAVTSENIGISGAIVTAKDGLSKDTTIQVYAVIRYDTRTQRNLTATASTSLTIKAAEANPDTPRLTVSTTTLKLGIGERRTVTATLTGVKDYNGYRMAWKNAISTEDKTLPYTVSGVTPGDIGHGYSKFDSQGKSTITVTGRSNGEDTIFPKLETSTGGFLSDVGNDGRNNITVTVGSGNSGAAGNLGDLLPGTMTLTQEQTNGDFLKTNILDVPAGVDPEDYSLTWTSSNPNVVSFSHTRPEGTSIIGKKFTVFRGRMMAEAIIYALSPGSSTITLDVYYKGSLVQSDSTLVTVPGGGTPLPPDPGSANTLYEISEGTRNKTITSGSANNYATIVSGWSRSVGSASMRYKVHSINWSISDTSVATIEKGAVTSENIGISGAIVTAKDGLTKDTTIQVYAVIHYDTPTQKNLTATASTSLTIKAAEANPDTPRLTVSSTTLKLGIGERKTVTATLTGVKDYADYRMDWQNIAHDAGIILPYTVSGVTPGDIGNGYSKFDSQGKSTITVTGRSNGENTIFPILQTSTGGSLSNVGNDGRNNITVTVGSGSGITVGDMDLPPITMDASDKGKLVWAKITKLPSGTTYTDFTAHWTLGDTSVASFSETQALGKATSSYDRNSNRYQAGVYVRGPGKTTLTLDMYYRNEKVGSTSTTVTVTGTGTLPSQDLAFAESSKTVTYGDVPFTNTATNNTPSGGAVTYASSNPQVATVNRTTGEVTIVGAGETTITATAAAVSNAFVETTASYTLTVRPKAITASAVVEPKVYDGSTEAKAAITFDGLVGNDSPKYQTEASFDTADAGTGKTVTVKVTLVNAGNYTLKNETVILKNGVINKGPAQTKTKELPIRYSNTETVTCDLKSELSGSLYTAGKAAGSTEVLESYRVENGVLSVQLKAGLSEDKVGSAATIPVTVTSNNFEDSTITITIRITDQLLPQVSARNISVVYNGRPVAGSSIQGTASYEGQTVAGTWSFKPGQNLTNVRDSGSKTVIFTPENSAEYAVVETTVTVEIRKADPSGQPSYTSINRSGMTLADAKLNAGSITVPGKIVWDNAETTVVSANTSYGWTFTPDDTENYKVRTGRIQPYTVYIDSGSDSDSSSSDPTYSVDIPKVTGGRVQISTTGASKGQRVTITVRPNGGYQLDQLTVTDAKGNELTVTDKGSGKYTFVMPDSKVTVTPVFKAAASQQPVTPTTTFRDVPANAYYHSAVQWAVSKGITAGTGNGIFSPDANCTRGQIAAFLWRAAGQPKPTTTVNPFTDIKPTDYNYQAILWAYEQGITSGTSSNTFSPNADCTRAQLVSFLWRSEGSSAASGSTFQDVSSSAYYANAISWAVQKGITSGTGGNSFSPDAVCSRAQAVTFLYRNAMK